MSLTRCLDTFQESENTTGNPSDDDMDSYSSDDSEEHGVTIVKGNNTLFAFFFPVGKKDICLLALIGVMAPSFLLS